jgi:hypothetical protein
MNTAIRSSTKIFVLFIALTNEELIPLGGARSDVFHCPHASLGNLTPSEYRQ